MLVVFIHNNYTEKSVAEAFAETGRVIVFNQSAFGAWVQRFISDGIARCAVPLFFLFAAFLQAKKAAPYPTLLKKKAKSLLLPYVLWMAIFFFFKQVVVNMNILPQLFGKSHVTSVLSWTAADWVQQFLGTYPIISGVSGPHLAVQFWFVRDLLVLTVISPAIIFLIKRVPAALFGLVAALYLVGTPLYFVVTEGLFWYVAGLLWGINDAPLLQTIDRVKWGEIALS